MLKATFSILVFILCIQTVFCQNTNLGFWTGTMYRDGSIMDVSFEFKMQNNPMLGLYNSASQKASGIPLDSLKHSGDSLSFQLMSEPVTSFKCKISNNKIEGQIISSRNISVLGHCGLKLLSSYN